MVKFLLAIQTHTLELKGEIMLTRLDSTLCKILLSKRMMWAWRFWWIEAARVGNDYKGYVNIGLNTKARRQQRINYM